MNKRPKRTRKNGYKNKKTTTQRYYGGSEEAPIENPEKEKEKEKERIGIIDNIGNNAENITSNAADYLSNKGLRLFGLQKVQNGDQPKNVESSVDNKMEEISNAASGVISDVGKVVNKGSVSIIENINDILSSSQVNETVSEAASETAAIGKKLFETINEKFDNPEFKQDAKEVLDNVAQYSDIALKAMDKPINDAVDKLNEAGAKALAGVASGTVKVGTDMMAAIPGVGAVVEMGKIINDASKAASSVVEAGSDAVQTASDFYIDTKKNMEEQMKKLDEQKKEATHIARRTTASINEFQDPFKTKNAALLGGRKTKRRLLKRKAKTKRVRFAI